MENLQNPLDMYTTAVGVLIPMVIAYFKDQLWSKNVKRLLTVGLTLLAAAGHMFYSGDFTVGDVGMSFLTILALCTTTYKWIWQPTGIAEQVETKAGVGKIR